MFSKDNCRIVDMEFSEYENGSILTGSIYAKDPIDGYSFILFEIKSLIIKALVIIADVANLRVEDNIEIFIKNEDELKRAKLKIIPCISKFMTIVPNVPSVSKSDFENSLKNLHKGENDFGNTMFWQYISYSVPNIEEGKTKFDIISQYRLLWTAFNSLYNMLYPDNHERDSIEKYSQKPYVIDYFDKMLQNAFSYKFLNDLINSNLTLGKGKENVSAKLKESIGKTHNKEISKYSLLCLYSIRNSTFHGSAGRENHLCRVAFEILNPLIKKSINQEILMEIDTGELH